METSSIYQKPTKSKSIYLYILGILGIGLLVYFGGDMLKTLSNLRGKSAITIDSFHNKAEVYINGEYAGATLYESTDIKPGENKITLKTDSRQYETTLNFIPSNDKYIHNVGVLRDLGVSDIFSSGQEFWFEQDNNSNVARVVSEPSGASVFIDNAEVGKTPYTSTKLSDGNYDLRVEFPGYESQVARINVKSDYTLNVAMKLFPTPVPTKIAEFPGSAGLYNVYTDKQEVLADTQAWVKAVLYWNDTRGINVDGQGIRKEKLFDYFVDYKGNLYDQDGVLVSDNEIVTRISKKDSGAYLGRLSDGDVVSAQAATTIEKLTGIAPGGDTATILETGVGWLRVRNSPSLGGTEIAKVNVGEEYGVLETQGEWIKIQVDSSIQGWISSTYAKIN